MKILLVFDKELDLDKEKILSFLKTNSTHISFSLYKGDIVISDTYIEKPTSHDKLYSLIGSSDYDKCFVFTDKQYIDNFFFHEYNQITIFSFYGWSHLTNLPKTNGVIYFILNYLALSIDDSGYRHTQNTGCIYDFHKDKRGIDEGMRQARFCPNCLERMNNLVDENKIDIYEDLKVLMNELSNHSKWNKDILDSTEKVSEIIMKRKPKKEGEVNAVIASAGDTMEERKLLTDNLERKFRVDNHESHCNLRLIIHGWEDLASQNGYPQDVINEKIIKKMDFVIAVFKHKLGTPTKDLITGSYRAVSGTAEELLQALNPKKSDHPIGMAYFYSAAPAISLDSPDFDKIKKDWDSLSDFKKTIQDKMIYKPYTDKNGLLEMVAMDIEKNIIDNFEN